MKRLVVLLPAAVGVVCATYTGIYLVRWEWNRAIIAGVFFLAAEVIVASAVVLERIRRSEDRITALLARREAAAPPADKHPSVALEALRETAPEPADRFSWLRDQSGQMNVFLPILLGAGVVASALAWLVERLARVTISPAMERRLAQRMDVLSLPVQGLLGAPAAVPARPPRRWPRRLGAGALALAVGVTTAMGIDFVADRTQTRPDVTDPDAQTFVALRLYGEIAEREPDRILEHLWSACTGPDVFRSRALPPPAVTHGGDGVFRLVIDLDVGANGAERLQGCLNDTTLDKVRARVIELAVR